MAALPAVIIVTSTRTQHRDDIATPPSALGGSPSSMDCWWSALSAHGLLDPASVYLACNANNYKYFEYEAWGKGVPLPNIINSGRSLGENLVEWSTLRLAVRAAQRGGGAAPRSVLLIAADCAPEGGAPTCEAYLGELLRVLASTGRSAALTRRA